MTRPCENPFRSSRISSLAYRFDSEFSWAGLISRLQEMNNRGALVGSEGSGKTTLLEQLEVQLNALGHRTTLLRAGPSGELPNSPLGHHDFLLLDSAECLNWPQRLVLRHRSRNCAGLVVTAHRPGLLPTLWTCRTSPCLFESLVDELLVDDPAAALIRKRDLGEVFQRHQGNVRAALRELYDHAARPQRDQASC